MYKPHIEHTLHTRIEDRKPIISFTLLVRGKMTGVEIR